MRKPLHFVEYESQGSRPESEDKTYKTGMWNQWEWQLKKRITTIDKLPFTWLTHDQKNLLTQVCHRFPMAITPYYLSLMNPEDPDDPIMKQVLPSVHETLSSETSYSDPLNEEANSPVKGLTHRYPDRVLFILTNSCAVYCRHCTRKRIWEEGNEITLPRTEKNTLPRKEIEKALDYILRHTEIRDVLISGGDPLILPVSLLEYVLKEVRSIPHVEIIRIGTRVPVVLPNRIDKPLLEVLERFGPIWLNTQFNHPREITEQSGQACDLLLRSGIPINNQTVLLRGINDRPEIIKELNQKLLTIKVRPYYLFQCDPVIGTEHFRTSLWKGVEIMEQLRGHTSGLAIPHFVIDLPGGGGKVPVLPKYVISQSNQQITFRNYEGKQFVHHEPHGQGL
jgi:lysine 2,3-aminomutase